MAQHKTTIKIDRQIIAGDIYPRWKKLVQSAKDSIMIFTPYLGNTLIRLLENKLHAVSSVTVITELKPEAFLIGHSHLTTIEQLIKRGIRVKSLEGLHAKVLLIDNAYAVLGSQNFTQKGRKNKEASIKLEQGIVDTKFLNQLLKWSKEAEEIDLELVQDLLKNIPKLKKKYKSFLKEGEEVFLNSKKELEAKKLEEVWQDILKAEGYSRFKLHDEYHVKIYASIGYVKKTGEFSDYLHLLGYSSLIPDQGYNFTLWELSDNKGIAKNKELERLDMYPILNADTLCMGFARVGKRRITYIRDGISWANNNLSIGDYTLSVVINFSSFESNKVNIKIDFKSSDENNVTAQILFDGTKYRIVNKEFQPSCSRDFIQEIEHGLFKRHQQFLQVFKKFFAPFRFAKLHREEKNVKEFLRGERYRVSLIEFANNPFLIVKSIDEKDL